MSTIAKQSINFSIINYVGLIISVVSTLFIYPLDFEAYGVLQFVMSTSQLFLPVVSLAVSSSIIYYFYEFQQKGKLSELITLLLGSVTLFSGLIYVLYPIVLKRWLFRLFEVLNMDKGIFKQYDGVIFGVTFLLILFAISNTILTNYKQITIPQIFVSILLKLVMAFLVGMVHLECFSLYEATLGLAAYYLGSVLFLWIYQRRYFEFKFEKISAYTKSRIGDISEYSLFNILSGLGSSLVFRLDIIMITLMIGAKEAGIYSLFLFLSNVIEIPSKGYVRIISPIISKAIKEGDNKTVGTIYKQSSINFLVLGGVAALVIYAGLESLLSLMKEGEHLVKALNIWVILALAKWIDMITSVNSQIISFSHVYRYNLLFLLVLGVSNVYLNYVFVSSYGMIGAAIATTISITLFNIVKYVFIKIRFELEPFTIDTLKGVVLLGVVALLLAVVPHLSNAVIDIIVRSGLTTIVLISAVYYWQLSEEMNGFIESKLKRIPSGK